MNPRYSDKGDNIEKKLFVQNSISLSIASSVKDIGNCYNCCSKDNSKGHFIFIIFLHRE